MATARLTDKTNLASNADKADLFYVVDTSDTTGSSAGTSKKVLSKYMIQTDKISMSNAEIIALDDGGASGEYKELIAAPGAGYMIVPLQATMICVGAGATESANIDLYMGFKETGTSQFWSYWRRFANTLAAAAVVTYSGNGTISTTGAMPSTIANTNFKVWSGGTFNGGWGMDIYITYQIVKMT